MKRSIRPVALALALLPALALLLAGCDTPGQRIDPSETTEAELGSVRVLPTALIEFSDQAPQRLVAQLAELPEVRDVEGRATVFLGDIENKTTVVSTNDFEMAMSRMRNRLINSDIAQDRLRFVERRARIQRLAERERVASEGFLADPPDYDPRSTFVLNGDFYRVDRGNVNQYYMQMNLVSFGTNEIVWTDDFLIKQVQGD